MAGRSMLHRTKTPFAGAMRWISLAVRQPPCCLPCSPCRELPLMRRRHSRGNTPALPRRIAVNAASPSSDAAAPHLQPSYRRHAEPRLLACLIAPGSSMAAARRQCRSSRPGCIPAASPFCASMMAGATLAGSPAAVKAARMSATLPRRSFSRATRQPRRSCGKLAYRMSRIFSRSLFCDPLISGCTARSPKAGHSGLAFSSNSLPAIALACAREFEP